MQPTRADCDLLFRLTAAQWRSVFSLRWRIHNEPVSSGTQVQGNGQTSCQCSRRKLTVLVRDLLFTLPVFTSCLTPLRTVPIFLQSGYSCFCCRRRGGGRGEAKSKKYVLRCLLKVAAEAAEWTGSGRLFKQEMAQELKVLAPVLVLILGTDRVIPLFDLSECDGR